MAKRTAEASAPSAPEAKRPKADDEGMSEEVKLQRDLLNSDPALHSLFKYTVIDNRPEGVKAREMARQFWASRQHLLQAFARSRDQKRGPQNALTKTKRKLVEGQEKLSLTQQQVADIFAQHPIVRRAYDELVPNRIASQATFFTRFFSSRLCKRLKGQKISDRDDPRDADIDRYLDLLRHQETETPGANVADHETAVGEEHRVPHFLDLEGNEQNHSQRKGNMELYRENLERDPSRVYSAINSLSQQLLKNTLPADTQRKELHAPAGMDEQTYNELRLRDLAEQESRSGVKLAIADASTIHSSTSTAPTPQRATDPSAILASLHATTATLDTPLDVAIAFSADDDPDDAPTTPPTFSSPAAIAAAHAQLTALLHQQSHISTRTDAPLLAQLPDPIAQDARLVHTTSREFLRIFYAVFRPAAAHPYAEPLPRDARDLPGLLTSLANSAARVDAVARDAEAWRAERLRGMEREVAEKVRKSLGRKRYRVDASKAGPGEREVRALMAPMVRAIDGARAKFGMWRRGEAVV